MLNLPNTDFEKLENTIHRLKVFLVILPFRRVTGIFLSYRLFRVLGQISESIKKLLMVSSNPKILLI